MSRSALFAAAFLATLALSGTFALAEEPPASNAAQPQEQSAPKIRRCCICRQPSRPRSGNAIRPLPKF